MEEAHGGLSQETGGTEVGCRDCWQGYALFHYVLRLGAGAEMPDNLCAEVASKADILSVSATGCADSMPVGTGIVVQ